MIIVDCKQRSAEWLAARRGLPTASQFSKIVTASGKPSSQAAKYMAELLAEHFLDCSLSNIEDDWLMRGTDLEESAIAAYEMCHDVDTTPVGFVLEESGTCGCSPDRLIGENGGLEIKCPGPAQHILYMLNDFGSAYKQQVQGCLWICEREWWDIQSYNPDLPPAVLRVHRDDEFIQRLSEQVQGFADQLYDAKEKLERQIKDDHGPASSK